MEDGQLTVGMLPYVDGTERFVGGGQRRGGIAGIDDIHRTVALLDQPGPSRAEVAHRTFGECFLEGLVVAPLLVDRSGQRAARLAAAAGLQAAPEEGVVPDLGGVVEDASRGFRSLP